MSKLNLRAGLVAALLSLAPAAVAGAALAQDADQPSVKVSYADLDLSQSAGRTELDRRIARAVDLVCQGDQSSIADLTRARALEACRTAARTSADRQVAAILSGARYADASMTIRPAGR